MLVRTDNSLALVDAQAGCIIACGRSRDQIYTALRRRAGAAVLLEAASERNAYGPNIVRAEQAFGRGRVLFVGADTLWKWHALALDGPGLTSYTLFWQLALRALAPSRHRAVGPSRNGRGDVQSWLMAERTCSTLGRRITRQLEATGPRSLPDARIEANIVIPDGQRLPVVFSPDGVDHNYWHTSCTRLSAGENRVLASLVNKQSQPLAVSQQVIEIDADTKEASDTGGLPGFPRSESKGHGHVQTTQTHRLIGDRCAASGVPRAGC